MILFTNNDKNNTDTLCKGSQACVDLVYTKRLNVDVRNLAEINKNEIPSIIKGSPTLIFTSENKIFYGINAIKMLKTLETPKEKTTPIPPTPSFLQDQQNNNMPIQPQDEEDAPLNLSVDEIKKMFEQRNQRALDIVSQQK